MKITLQELRQLIREEERIWIAGHWQTKGKPVKNRDPVNSKLTDLVDDVLNKVERAKGEDLGSAERSTFQHQLKQVLKDTIKAFKAEHFGDEVVGGDEDDDGKSGDGDADDIVEPDDDERDR